MRGEHPVLAVDRHHVTRPEQREHGPQLLLVRMAGHVHGAISMQHLAPRARAVDRVVDAQLVPGTGFAEMMTVSPGSTDTALWSP